MNDQRPPWHIFWIYVCIVAAMIYIGSKFQ